jgi:hypothetical protein
MKQEKQEWKHDNWKQESNKIVLQRINKTRLWQENVPKSNVEQTKVMKNSISIYTPWAPSSKKFIKKLPIYMWPMFTHVGQCAPMCETWMD